MTVLYRVSRMFLKMSVAGITWPESVVKMGEEWAGDGTGDDYE